MRIKELADLNKALPTLLEEYPDLVPFGPSPLRAMYPIWKSAQSGQDERDADTPTIVTKESK